MSGVFFLNFHYTLANDYRKRKTYSSCYNIASLQTQQSKSRRSIMPFSCLMNITEALMESLHSIGMVSNYLQRILYWFDYRYVIFLYGEVGKGGFSASVKENISLIKGILVRKKQTFIQNKTVLIFRLSCANE